MHKVRQRLIEIVGALNSLGFSLIVGSVVYFIIGTATRVVHGKMLDWTFCGSANYLFGVEWCGIEGHTDELWFNQFVHRLMNVSIPWFMIFWGFILIGVCSLLLDLLRYRYTRGS